MDKNEILSAKLESYEVLGDRSFYDVADEIRKHLPDSFYAYLSNNIHEQE
jgi:hypothetical protein